MGDSAVPKLKGKESRDHASMLLTSRSKKHLRTQDWSNGEDFLEGLTLVYCF